MSMSDSLCENYCLCTVLFNLSNSFDPNYHYNDTMVFVDLT